jgi:glucosamine--fructose-6-phosphate aminotransferase (isomerizing)
MRDQVLATPAALLAAFDGLERATRLVLATPEIYRARRIVLIGSGDSLFAAKEAEWSLLAHSGLPVEVRPPMEAGRYLSPLATDRDLENTLVIALSNSGAAARVAEAATLLKARGALVLAVTRAENGRLAGVASKILPVPVPDLPPGPGFGPYLFALTALLLLGIRIGEVRMGMTMDEAQARRGELKRAVEELGAALPAFDAATGSLAARVGERPLVELLGAGPDHAVADYGAAKLLEAAGHHAYARELEEWTHLNYFDARPDDITTVLAIDARSRAQGRAVELMAYLHKLGRRVVVVGGGPAAQAALSLGHAVVAVPAARHELWSPLLLSAPIALLAAHLAAATGARYGRGATGRWADSADASTVQKSALWEPPA